MDAHRSASSPGRRVRLGMKVLSFATLLLMLAALAPAAVTADAPKLTGAVYTSNQDGSVIDENIYPSADAVYLTGGPCSGGSSLPDGDYYFQVTDPGGQNVLSTDPYTNRDFTISGGKITATSGSHVTNSSVCGGITIQLYPYTASRNGEYKLWVTPVSEALKCLANETDPFCGDTKTDNFKALGGFPSSTSTSVSPTSVTAAVTTVTDTATVTGGSGTPTGTVDFYLCSGTTCASGGNLVASGVALDGSGVASATYATAALAPGVYTFRAEYSGDGFYMASADNGQNETFNVEAAPAIHVVKSANPTGLPAGGGSVTYTYTVTNAGNVPLTSVSVSDNKCSPVTYVSGDANANNLLDLTESWTYSCTTTITATTTNTATATGHYGDATVTDQAQATVTVTIPNIVTPSPTPTPTPTVTPFIPTPTPTTVPTPTPSPSGTVAGATGTPQSSVEGVTGKPSLPPTSTLPGQGGGPTNSNLLLILGALGAASLVLISSTLLRERIVESIDR